MLGTLASVTSQWYVPPPAASWSGSPIVTPYLRIDALALLDSKMASFPHSPRSCSDEPIAPQDDHADMSSDCLNIAADNSLISFGFKFGTVTFRPGLDAYVSISIHIC